MADFSHTDKQSIQTFIDGDLASFIGDLKKILAGDPSMKDFENGVYTDRTAGAIEKGKPIMMGRIDRNDLMTGTSFTDALSTSISTVVDVLTAQQDTFDEIDEGLRTTLHELFKTQGDNLGNISAEEFSTSMSDSGFDDSSSSGDSTGDNGSDSTDGESA
ncbi:type VII secretion system-associated protein [Streptomyces sp. GQFP]|uniref:type VII secretion system-associated protein n=1 Tax=Streptomyces sp. GQFP TaxID=2907545 RepID=UPI001F223AC7|nr:type VII secretion system-associated protein [Streptomyces sp. GQFP]UIX32002.1 type VII secretion system-associated protein [Streptomyces sp. GQFP]